MHVAVVRHPAVVPEIRRQSRTLRQPSEVDPLLGQHLPGTPAHRPVHTPVRHAVAPLEGLPVQVRVVREADAGPQVAAHILDPALHLALRLCPIRLAHPQLESDAQRQVQHPPVPLRTPVRIPAQHHHLRVVIQAPPRRPAEVFERVDVALHEARHVRTPDELDVDRSRPAQHHHERPEPVLASVCADVAEAPPVHLRLLAGLRLEPHRRAGLSTTAWRHVGLQDRIPPVVAPFTQLPVQHDAVVQTLPQPAVDVAGVGVQLGRPRRSLLRLRHSRRPQILAHRVPGDAQLPCDPADRMPLTPHLVQVFHRPTFQQRSPPRQSAGRMLLLRGGSIPFRHHGVIFKPSLTLGWPSGRASPFGGAFPFQTDQVMVGVLSVVASRRTRDPPGLGPRRHRGPSLSSQTWRRRG